MRILLIAIVVIGLIGVGIAGAQEDVEAEVISAGNVARLGSVSRIEFADLPEEAGEVENGWFAISQNLRNIPQRYDSEYIFALLSPQTGVTLTDDKGNFIGTSTVVGQDGLLAMPFDVSFSAGRGYPILTSIVSDGNEYKIALNWLGSNESAVIDFPPARIDTPLKIWSLHLDEAFSQLMWSIWLEVAPANSQTSPYVITTDVVMAEPSEFDLVSSDYMPKIMNIPSSDPESVIRIGRIEPPLAVTVTEDGRVKRWNMETGEVTAEVQIDPAEGLPIYGAVNAGGEEYLVWRDPASNALHLLNFQTGEDRVVVQLDGLYMPFIFLSSAADVIIGVNVDDAPVVVAWDVATGERYDLGEYRECSRPPDMARLSQDGTTLVIGCDTGLDIWRVQER